MVIAHVPSVDGNKSDGSDRKNDVGVDPNDKSDELSVNSQDEEPADEPVNLEHSD